MLRVTHKFKHWYNHLSNVDLPGGVTAKTIFLDLTDDELNLIQSLSKSQLAGNVCRKFVPSDLTPSTENLGMERRLTNEELEGELALSEKITEVMEPHKKYFCRFSTRSPKDGVSVPKDELARLEPVQRLQRKLQLLCVTNGAEVVRILTRYLEL